MASPFTVFRKNQKVMLAVLTILAMFGFVFVPILMQSFGVGSGPVNEVVVSSKYGDLRKSDIERLIQTRQKLRAVLSDLLKSRSARACASGTDSVLTFGWVTSCSAFDMANSMLGVRPSSACAAPSGAALPLQQS